jgi:hypothetical protein
LPKGDWGQMLRKDLEIWMQKRFGNIIFTPLDKGHKENNIWISEASHDKC